MGMIFPSSLFEASSTSRVPWPLGRHGHREKALLKQYNLHRSGGETQPTKHVEKSRVFEDLSRGW
jgi:hypothetical protein